MALDGLARHDGVEVGNEWVEEGSPSVDLGSEAHRRDPDQRFAVETNLDRLLSEPNTLGRTERRSAGAALPPARFTSWPRDR